MEKKRTTEKGKGPDNEVRVTGTTYLRTYLAYIARLFQEKHEKVIVKAMGYAIPRAVALAMLVRRRFKGIHQIAEVSMIDLQDRDRARKVALMTITLSKKELDKNHIGYAAPLPDSEVTEYQPFVPGQAPPAGAARGAGPRGRGRGGRRGGFRGRGRGRGYGGYGYEEEGYGSYEDYEGGYGGSYEGGNFRGRSRGGFRFGGFRGGRRGGRRGGFRSRGAF